MLVSELISEPHIAVVHPMRPLPSYYWVAAEVSHDENLAIELFPRLSWLRHVNLILTWCIQWSCSMWAVSSCDPRLTMKCPLWSYSMMRCIHVTLICYLVSRWIQCWHQISDQSLLGISWFDAASEPRISDSFSLYLVAFKHHGSCSRHYRLMYPKCIGILYFLFCHIFQYLFPAKSPSSTFSSVELLLVVDHSLNISAVIYFLTSHW
jgi:hypothetical protein